MSVEFVDGSYRFFGSINPDILEAVFSSLLIACILVGLLDGEMLAVLAVVARHS